MDKWEMGKKNSPLIEGWLSKIDGVFIPLS
jgi:hypothetical protein